MKKVIIIMSGLLLLSCGLLMADFPGIKFVAPMEGVSGPVDDQWTLTVKATSSETIDLLLDEASEIEDEEGGVLTPEELASLPAGTVVKIAAVFMEAGLYVRELEVVKDDNEFEFQGSLESVGCEPGLIVLLGFEISLAPDTEIRSADGDLLACGDLVPEQYIKVKGIVTDTALIATKIKVGIPGKEHLLMEFDAVVLEMTETMTETEWLVAIGGNNPEASVPVLVVLDGNTEIEGEVVVGTEVEITGVLTPELAVLAKLIKVEGPKGSKNGKDGKGDDDEADEDEADEAVELEVKWSPDVIRAAPKGTRTVRLMLKHGIAEEDLEVSLAADLSPDLLIEFDSPVTIPQGERDVEVEITFLSQSGSGTLTATLPEGASDELDIDLRPRPTDDE